MSKWLGDPPKICDLCFSPITEVFIDGRTVFGCWASMCPNCHVKHGKGLGLGLGQKYQRQENGSFKKVEG